jgi:hypothetical protein
MKSYILRVVLLSVLSNKPEALSRAILAGCASTSRIRNSPILGAFLLRRAPSHWWCEMPHEILPTAAKLEKRAHEQVDADRRVARFHLRDP